MINHCIIINLDCRTDLLNKLQNFIEKWREDGKIFHRMAGTFYKNKTHVLNEYIKNNRINLNGSGFRNNKNSLLGELGTYNSHYECWKYITDNKLDYCLILEDGINFLRNDFNNLRINDDVDFLYINKEIKKDNNQLIGYGLQGYVVSYFGALLLQKLCYTLVYPIDIHIRNICNNNLIKNDVLTDSFVERNHNRISSIEEIIMDDLDNLNNKQNMDSIINRIISKMVEKNINIDDFI